MHGIALTKGLCQGGHQMGILVVAINVCTVLLAGVLEAQCGTVFAGLGVYDPNTVNFLNGVVYLLEDFGAFAACAKGIDGNGHTDEQGDKEEYSVECHCMITSILS